MDSGALISRLARKGDRTGVGENPGGKGLCLDIAVAKPGPNPMPSGGSGQDSCPPDPKQVHPGKQRANW